MIPVGQLCTAGQSSFVDLHVVKEHKLITSADFIEIPRPGQVVGLMNGYSFVCQMIHRMTSNVSAKATPICVPLTTASDRINSGDI